MFCTKEEIKKIAKIRAVLRLFLLKSLKNNKKNKNAPQPLINTPANIALWPRVADGTSFAHEGRRTPTP